MASKGYRDLCWKDLNDEQYKAISLRAEGHSLREIASMTNYTLNTLNKMSSELFNRLLEDPEHTDRILNWRLLKGKTVMRMNQLYLKAINGDQPDLRLALDALSKIDKAIEPFAPMDMRPTQQIIAVLARNKSEQAQLQGAGLTEITPLDIKQKLDEETGVDDNA